MIKKLYIQHAIAKYPFTTCNHALTISMNVIKWDDVSMPNYTYNT